MKTPGKLAELLAAPEARKVSVQMKHATFYIKLATYESLRAECVRRDRKMSHVIEAMILDFVAGKYDETAE